MAPTTDRRAFVAGLLFLVAPPLLCDASATCAGTIEEGFDYAGNDVSRLSNVSSPEDCCAACAADEKCSYWTLWVSGKTCFKKSSDSGRNALDDHVSGSAAAPLPPGSCTTDLDCSLNGVCTSGKCACDKPWTGYNCETLSFKPAKVIQGYGMSPNMTTWGGGVIKAASGEHHMFVSRMTNECLLDTWTRNSRIDHAVSKTGPEGPYTFSDVAVNTWAHNAAPIVLKDGSYAIIHIGTGTGGPDGGDNCTSPTFSERSPALRSAEGLAAASLEARLEADALAAARLGSGGSTIHVSDSLEGPWSPLATSLGKCNNPAPWVHPNGTIFIGCGGSFLRAESLAGPWRKVASFPTGGGPAGTYEDPQIYTDARGRFHCLYHVYRTDLPPTNCVNSTVSAHSFSEDGVTWTMSKTAPYGTQVELESGETVTVATRERPKPFFNEQGVMTHLLNGVCGAASCTQPKTGCVDCKVYYWDYTLVQPTAAA